MGDTQKRTKLVIAVSTLAVVAACGGGGGLAVGIDTLGSVFAQAFAEDPNGEALADIATANLVVNPNIDPFNP